MSLEELAIIKKFKCYFKASIIVNEKVTSLKIDPELWKKVKMLAVKRGVTLKSLIEELLVLEVEGEEFSLGEANVSTQLLETLEERSRRGLLPFTIKSKRSAVELVKEGR
ncbi:MAG: hypothetical protein QXU11_09530 [Thermoproteota archaeon]|nr:ribbon-helix-helix domain-containing protein [Candidatus Brockarchaeota archaeon]